jgi:hypothetical protein
MATTIQLRRGTAAAHSTFTGALGEITFDTTNKTLRAHDASVVGGTRLAVYDEVTDRLQVANANITFETKAVALAANTAQNNLINDRLQVANAAALFVNVSGDTMSGDLAMGSNKITGLGAPTTGTDATTKTYVDTAVANIVDTAPEALNTLNELAAALGDDANFATTTATSLGTKAANTYVNSTFQTIAVERAALANTNAYIAGVQSNLDATNANVDQKLGATASVALTGAVTGTANFSANAVSITTTATSDPTITLGGDLTGSVTLTNLGDGTLTAAVVDDSHNHSSSTGAFNVGADLTVSGGDIILSGTGRIQGVDTVSAGTDAANKTYVDTAVANIVDTAPEALNTLNELAAALGDDANFATTTATSLGTKAANTYVNNTFQTIATERAALANTNLYIATKQNTITGGATTITSSDLTASRALVSDGSGKVVVSPVTSTELGYLDGVTSAIQTQLSTKIATTDARVEFLQSANTSVTNDASSITTTMNAVDLNDQTLVNPAGFITINIGGVNYKLPFYS